jgi:glycosyltransferase involved in cell wall biosynthesis
MARGHSAHGRGAQSRAAEGRRLSAPYLSVVVPVFEERDNLAPLHGELDAALSDVSGGVEFLYVDDGSCDGSSDELAGLAKRDYRMRVLTLARNYGQSAALDAGFRAARGAVIATIDADLQNDPADLLRLLAALDRADVVNGIRVSRRDTFVRRISSQVANALRNWLTREAVTDVGCSVRVMRAETLRQVKLYHGMHRFLPTLLRMEGARVIELPVSHRPRRHGRSKYGIANRLPAALIDVFAVRWMMRRRLSYRVLPPSD